MDASALQMAAERVARNNAVFREANEAIREKTDEWEMTGLLPALCECANALCHGMLRLTPRQYEDVRAKPRWFITAPGHEANDQGWARVVEDHGSYLVVEKVGEAGEAAEQLGTRSE
jgi:hypothetical protein